MNFGMSSTSSGEESAIGNDAALDISPERDSELARQRHDHNAPNAPRLSTRATLVPATEVALRLEFQPQPGGFDTITLRTGPLPAREMP
jgi:hypothetical protein